jgi:oxygen-dependent protoporphyrinogen oxidase
MNKTLPVQPHDTTRARNARRIVIVGGGISGLSAAWYLQRQAAARGVDVEYTLLESAPRWGGKVLTEEVAADGAAKFVVEAGPDAFITQKPWALELAHELGIGERLIAINDHVTSIYVLDRGRPVVMPEGVLLVVPTRFWPFVISPLFSIRAKLRMGLELLIPPRLDDADETLADFVRRRLGSEALDKIAEPLMSGIYNADAEAMSIMATFPRFRQLEKKYGSLIRGMVQSRAAAKQPGQSKPAPLFMSLQNGTQELIDALIPKLYGDLRLDTRVVDLHALPDGGYRLITNQEDVLHADAVILTTPAYTAAELVRAMAPDAAMLLDGIRYVGTGTVSLAFRAGDITKPLNGLGLVVPKGENRPINAITISSTKFSHRAPEGTVLLRVFFGGSRSPASMDYDDARLLGMVRDELRDIMGVDAAPIFQRIYRWPNANPQYDTGHLGRVARIEAALPRGVYVTGGAYRGVGMPDCVYQSRCTMEHVLDDLTSNAAQKVNS